MAIIKGFHGAEVHINIDNQPTMEYICEDDDIQIIDHYSLAYIESQPDSAFSVVIHLNEDFTTNYICPMAAHVYVDGALTNRRTFPLNRITQTGGVVEVINRAEDFDEHGHQVYRAFQFGKTEIVEDEDGELGDVDDLVSQVKELGEIKVTLHRKLKIEAPDPVKIESMPSRNDTKLSRRHQKRHMRSVPQSQKENRLSRLEGLQSIPEKALKGRSMGIRATFGAAVPQPDSPTHSTRTNTKRNRYHYVDKPNNPLAIFVFRYRSRGDLKAEYIIPITPEPEPELKSLKLEQKFTDVKLSLAKWEPEDESMEDLDIDGSPVPRNTLNLIQSSVPELEESSLHTISDVQYNTDPILEIGEGSYDDDDDDDDEDVIYVSSNPIKKREGLIQSSHYRVIDLTS